MVGKSLQEEGYVNMPMDVFYAALMSAYKNETLLISPAACQDICSTKFITNEDETI